jgi:hypothetical protein
MLPRKEFAVLCGLWDNKERYVLMVLGGVGRPMGEQAVLDGVRFVAPPMRESRYRKAIERLRQGRVISEVEPGLLGIAEPEAWVGRIAPQRLASIDAALAVLAELESPSPPGRESGTKGKPGRPSRGKIAEPEQPQRERVSPSTASPPSRSGATLDDVADRAAVVFGAEVGEQLRLQSETLAYRVGGSLDRVLAAIVRCEVTNFRSDSPVGFLVWRANRFRSSRIPDRVQARLASPPRPIGSGPRSSQGRPTTCFRTADHPIPRPQLRPNMSTKEMVHRLIREKREAELAAR